MPAVVHVNAFADRPFSGNPAAVCLLDTPPDTTWMQAIAAELNLPATAFVWQLGEHFGLRWFTAQTELTLCGHGTLAAAHVLFGVGAASTEAISFQTTTDTLVARKLGALIELDFPAEASHQTVPPIALTRALNVEPVRIERNRLDYLVELESEAAVQSLRPDLSRLAEVETRGVIVTARGADGADFVSRFFAPRVGIDEDHITGSAHCCLGPYWQQQLGRSMLVGRQLSRRGGVVHVRVAGDRVRLSGKAVTVARGELSSETHAKAVRPASAEAPRGPTGFPSGNADERELLLSWLAFLRGAVLRKIEGVSDDQARWRPDGQLISLLGIVNHLTHVEWRWIDGSMRGQAVSRSEAEFAPGPELDAPQAAAAYRARAAATDAYVRSRLSLSEPCLRGENCDLRWVLLHLINETARHAGHADATRELLDGTTGQ